MSWSSSLSWQTPRPPLKIPGAWKCGLDSLYCCSRTKMPRFFLYVFRRRVCNLKATSAQKIFPQLRAKKGEWLERALRSKTTISWLAEGEDLDFVVLLPCCLTGLPLYLFATTSYFRPIRALVCMIPPQYPGMCHPLTTCVPSMVAAANGVFVFDTFKFFGNASSWLTEMTVHSGPKFTDSSPQRNVSSLWIVSRLMENCAWL